MYDVFYTLYTQLSCVLFCCDQYIKMPSCQYRKSPLKINKFYDRLYLHNEISSTSKMTYLYWIGTLGLMDTHVLLIRVVIKKDVDLKT